MIPPSSNIPPHSLPTMTESNEFLYKGGELEVTPQMKQAFTTDGFIIIKGLLSAAELAIVEECLHGPESLSSETYSFGECIKNANQRTQT